ncbi:hypothetical protein [Streptomyces buecherae]|uniref:hypothetical protein n=1 Tax=Streptomyces buecherae TaxID=2763006 RepID=UPI0036A9367E
MRFEKQSGRLTSAFLAVPEEPSQDDGEGAEWLSVPARPGGLSVTPGTDFDRSRPEGRAAASRA